MTLSRLPKFTIGGSVHIITNNQVGFTTTGQDSRSTPYASDIVKSFGIPIIRLNASDVETPEILVKVAEFVIEYWSTFKKDILIDMIGFRRYGHNEVDEPAFTQPKMYEKIRGDFDSLILPRVYADSLINQGIVSSDDVSRLRDEIRNHFD